MLRWAGRLASLKLTLAAMLWLGAGVIISYRGVAGMTWALVPPLSLLAVNLCLAIVVTPSIRRHYGLLIFHLALLAVVVLLAISRLTYLKGEVELAEGEEFSAELVQAERAPWHWWRLDRVKFVNQGFAIDYAPGVKRGATRNQVSWLDEGGRAMSGVIGDNQPLVLYGYRFYTSFNKGFAPAFAWYPKHGEPALGTVHLPGYPLYQYRQAQEWTLPNSKVKLWTMLQFDEVLLDPNQPSQFRLPREHQLIVRAGGARHEMKPGDRIELESGALVYQGLRSWMGYSVFSDPTTPWLLAACLVAVLGLAWYFWDKFLRRPWSA